MVFIVTFERSATSNVYRNILQRELLLLVNHIIRNDWIMLQCKTN